MKRPSKEEFTSKTTTMNKPKLEDFTVVDYKAYSEALEEFILNGNKEVEFKLGEIVEVVKELNGHCFDVGQKVKLIKSENEGFTAKNSSNKLTWWVTKDEIKKIETK